MVKLVKLVTGDEVVAGFSETVDTVILDTPVRMAFSQQGVAMVPYTPFTKDDAITINKINVLYIADVEEELANAYNSKFGKGVLTASSLALG